MAGRKSDFTLTKLDDLFTTQAQRDEEQLSKIRDIPLELIDDFPDHPFKVRDDEDMMQLVESVKERGVTAIPYSCSVGRGLTRSKQSITRETVSAFYTNGTKTDVSNGRGPAKKQNRFLISSCAGFWLSIGTGLYTSSTV